MAEIRFFEDLELQQRTGIAEYISGYTCSALGMAAKMRPVPYDKVMSDEECALVALEGNSFAGYITAGDTLQDGKEFVYQQVGGLVVPDAFRGRGIAKLLIEEATLDIIRCSNIPFAFCNPVGMKSFISVGFEAALDGELPSEAKSIYDNTAVVYPMHKFVNLRSYENKDLRHRYGIS